MASRYWLLKTEPETYSFERLLKEKKTNWNDVRNFQARNFLREVKKGDITVIYHSGDAKSVVGIAECVREGYPDIDADDGKEWVQIDIAPVKVLPHPVPLGMIKATASLKEMPLIRHTRLSVMPITKVHYETLLELAEKKK
jgi:predicted RNA-binding protein with PUA-like domain